MHGIVQYLFTPISLRGRLKLNSNGNELYLVEVLVNEKSSGIIRPEWREPYKKETRRHDTSESNKYQ